MNTSTLYHGFFQKGEDHQELTRRVLSHCPSTRRLYLLGLTLASRRTESLFTTSSATCTTAAHYYLLVVVEKPADASLDSLQDKLENNLQHWVPSTALVVSEERFTAWLLEGHPFAGAVCHKGLLLFAAEDQPPLPTPCPLDQDTGAEENHRLYQHTRLLVSELLAGAQLYHLRRHYPLSAFLLHQAAEQALRTMMILCTGYRPTTHSLDKLLRYASMFCHPLPEVFPRHVEKEKRLFSLLSRAYLEPRYTTGYTISSEDLSLLTGKVKRIQHLFEQQCGGVGKGQSPEVQVAPAQTQPW